MSLRLVHDCHLHEVASVGVEAALRAAALDLRDAADTFAAMREQQEAGHFPEVGDLVETFVAKAAAARAALPKSSPEPTPPAAAAFTSGESGSGEDLPSPTPAEATAPVAEASAGRPSPKLDDLAEGGR
jgi:hypothetical protein